MSIFARIFGRRHIFTAIRKGKIAKPTEFGKLVTIQESEHQIITGYEVYWVEKRNVSDNSVVPGSGHEERRPIYAPIPAASWAD